MKKILLAIAVASTLGGCIIANAQSVPTIMITPQILENGAVNATYTEMLSASTTGIGPFSWTVFSGALPPGVSLSATSSGQAAILSGIPTDPGAYNFVIDATNGTTATTQNYTIEVEGSGAATSTIPVVVLPPVSPTPATTTMTTATTTTTTTITTTTIDTSTIATELVSAEAQLAELENLLAETPSVNPGGPLIPVGVVFQRDLTIGSVGPDVMALQEFLNQNGYPVAASGPGSAGSETDYFGPLTQAALAQYQAANEISPAQGYYGPITRAKIGAEVSSMASSTTQ